jgi:hypothetical protein
MQSDLIGAWMARLDRSGCDFASTFAPDGTYGSGVVCSVPASPDVHVEWEIGAYTFAPDGRINFIPATWACGGAAHGGYTAQYSGAMTRPTVTFALSPQEIVLYPNVDPPFPEGAAMGCFSADWTFVPSR